MSSIGAPLTRTLGVFSATLMVVGGTIGSGIFFTPAEVARALPSNAGTLGMWVLGGLISRALPASVYESF